MSRIEFPDLRGGRELGVARRGDRHFDFGMTARQLERVRRRVRHLVGRVMIEEEAHPRHGSFLPMAPALPLDGDIPVATAAPAHGESDFAPCDRADVAGAF